MKKKATTDSLPKKGLSLYSIFRLISKKTRLDLDFKKDYILGSMCTLPPKMALRSFIRYNQVNLGDPGLFPGSMELESQAIELLGNLLQTPHGKGVFTTGGTEANLIAVKTALLTYLAKHPENQDRRELKLMVPQSAHFSFDKATQLMGIKLIKIPLTEDFTMDIDSLKRQLDEKCFCIVGVAGTTGLGVIDPIQILSDIALEKSIYLHVDAAFGGFVIPFLDDNFRQIHPFDFSLKGVQSISIDPHKMGRGVTPGGAIIFREETIYQETLTHVDYLAGGRTKHLTLVGTRSGAAVLACYSSILREGFLGYEKTAKKAMKTTHLLSELIASLEGYDLVTLPTINVVGIRSNFCTAEFLGKKLRKKRIAVSVFRDYIRIVMMPHVNRGKIRYFGRILKEIYHATQSSN